MIWIEVEEIFHAVLGSAAGSVTVSASGPRMQPADSRDSFLCGNIGPGHPFSKCPTSMPSRAVAATELRP